MDIEVLEQNNVEVDTFYRKARYEDEAIVVNILCISFKNDPHMNWLLEKSGNPEKLKIMMTYLFHKTMNIGKIYLSKDEKAVALWKSEIKEELSLEYIMRNLRFLMDIGILSVLRILKNERFTYKQYPKRQKYVLFQHFLLWLEPPGDYRWQNRSFFLAVREFASCGCKDRKNG